MIVHHRLVGYSRETDRMVESHEIPGPLLKRAAAIAEVGGDDPEAAWSYALSPVQAAQIAALLGIPIDPERLEFFLEAFTSSGKAA